MEKETKINQELLNKEIHLMFEEDAKKITNILRNRREKERIIRNSVRTIKEISLEKPPSWPRAEVRVTIEKLLDQGLPRIYTPELFEQKTTAVFQHVYDAYYGAERSVYAAA